MKVIEHISKHRDSGTTFVFPSELVARFWEEQWLLASGQSAIQGGRFISWDVFKEKNQNRSKSGLPINQNIRWLFVEQLLEENSSQGFFRSLVPESHKSRSHSFFSFVQSILASLYHFARQTDSFKQNLNPVLVHDLEILHQKYTAFLEKNDLFDPNYIDPDFNNVDYSCIIFFPQLLEDFSEYEAAISENNLISTFSMGRIDVPVPLHEYQHVQAELKDVLLRVRQLLEAGIAPEDIWISAGDYESIFRELVRLGREMDVPLQVRQGRSLSELPGSRIFGLIHECIRSRFSYQAVSALFLDPSLRWQHGVRRVLRKAADRHCVATHTGNEWAVQLRKSKAFRGDEAEDTLDADFIEKLFTLLNEMSRVRSFTAFSDIVDRLFKEFVSCADTEIQGIYRLAEQKLGALKASSAALGLESRNSLAFFMRVLENASYVPQQKGRGVQVLPYRVGAGAEPEYHFILQLNQQAANVTRNLHPYLQSYEKQLAELDDMNLTAGFLRAYQKGGANVYASFSRENYAGTQLPPEDFVLADCIVDAKVQGLESGFADVLPLSEIYGAGYRYNSVRTDRRGANFTKDAVPENLRPHLLVQGKNEDKPVFSSTGIDEYLRCPFAYFLRYAAGVDEYPLNPRIDSPLALGSIAHDLFDAVEEALKADSNIRDAAEFAEMILQNNTWRMGALFPAARQLLHSKLHLVVQKYAECRLIEIESFPEIIFEDSEKDVSLDTGDFKLRGRIDCIHSIPNEGLIITDFKWGKAPEKSKIMVGKDTPFAETFKKSQLPLYVLLCNAAETLQARYYSMAKSAFVPVIGSWNKGRSSVIEDVKGYLELSLELINTRIQELKGGDVHTPDDCDPCRYRSVCRVKYRIQ